MYVSYPACIALAAYSNLWLITAVPYFFRNYLINGTTFMEGKNLFEIKMYVLILSTTSSEIFVIIRKIERDIAIDSHTSSSKVFVILVRF